MTKDRNIIINLDHVTAGYDGRAQISDVTLSIADNDFVGIIGPNGGGKTTLLKTILGIIKPMEGKVSYLCDGLPADKLIFGYLPQYNNIDRDFPIKVEDMVLQGLNCRKPLLSKFNKRHKEEVKNVLSQLDISNLAQRPIKELSGGQLQRVLLARAVVSQPDALLLDEPNTFIDHKSQEQMFELIERISPKCAVVMVSHDIDKTRQLATTIVEVNEKVTIRTQRP